MSDLCGNTEEDEGNSAPRPLVNRPFFQLFLPLVLYVESNRSVLFCLCFEEMLGSGCYGMKDFSIFPKRNISALRSKED